MKPEVQRRIAVALWVVPVIIIVLLRLMGKEVVVIRFQGGLPPTSFEARADGIGLILVAFSLLGLLWTIFIVVRRALVRRRAPDSDGRVG
jgi:hypothetical protein